jgi:hypothetical protein
MERRLPIVFEKIWVCVSRKESRARADIGVVVAIHQTLNKINQTQRLSFPFPHFVTVIDGIL